MRGCPHHECRCEIDLWLLFCHSNLSIGVIFYLGGIGNLNFHSFDERG